MNLEKKEKKLRIVNHSREKKRKIVYIVINEDQ